MKTTDLDDGVTPRKLVWLVVAGGNVHHSREMASLEESNAARYGRQH